MARTNYKIGVRQWLAALQSQNNYIFLFTLFNRIPVKRFLLAVFFSELLNHINTVYYCYYISVCYTIMFHQVDSR